MGRPPRSNSPLVLWTPHNHPNSGVTIDVVTMATMTVMVNSIGAMIPRDGPMLRMISSTKPRAFINVPIAMASRSDSPPSRAAASHATPLPVMTTARSEKGALLDMFRGLVGLLAPKYRLPARSAKQEALLVHRADHCLSAGSHRCLCSALRLLESHVPIGDIARSPPAVSMLRLLAPGSRDFATMIACRPSRRVVRVPSYLATATTR